MFYFADPLWLWLLVSVPIIYWVARWRRTPLKLSSVRMHKNIRTASWVSVMQGACFYIALAALVVAFAQPTLYMKVEKPAVDSRDFLMVIDTSDSMEWGMVDPTIADGLTNSDKPAILTGARPKNIVKRITAAQLSIETFLGQREGDRVGFIIFDKRAYFGWPLTTDLRIIEKRVAGLATYVGAGTEFDGKVSPIQSAIKHFDDVGQAKTKVIVMVTDGEGNIAESRIKELSGALKQRDIKVYVIGVGYKTWDQVPETQDLRNLVAQAGGTVIEVLDPVQMRSAFAEINQLEKSIVYLDSKLEPTSIAHWFMILGLVFMSIFGLFAVLTADEL